VTLIERVDGEPTGSTCSWARADLTSIDADPDPVLALVDQLNVGDEPITFERVPNELMSESPHDAHDPFVETVKSAAIVPAVVAEDYACLLGVATLNDYVAWPANLVESLRLVTGVLASAWHRRHREFAVGHARPERARLGSRVERASARDVATTAALHFDEIIGESPSLRAALARLQEVADSDTTVLLLGETGTGKELFARALHAHSPRRSHQLVSVNCAALPPTLIESELFGHERGAFTGAMTLRQGRFELAHRGTLFLDEIGDLPLDLQAKLLRVLQEGEFERLGSSTARKVDVRIVGATHRDLDSAVADGEFRSDLFYRLNVFPIRLPALRERRNDIPALVRFLVRKRQARVHRHITHIPPDVMEMLQQHSWPGNIRELENVLERALIHSTGDTLVLLEDDIERPVDAAGPDSSTLWSVERAHIEDVLRECGGRINGQGNAAERLGLHPNTLRFRMKKLGIVRSRMVPLGRQQNRAR